MTYNNPEPSQLANTNLARPFPQLGGVQVMSAPSSSHYNALYLKLQRRFSHGVSFLTSTGTASRSTTAAGSGPRRRLADPVERVRSGARDRALGLRLPAALDNLLAMGSALWQRSQFPDFGGVVDAVLGGWQLGGIFTMQSGFPFTVLCGPGNIQNGGGVCYPDATGVDWQLPGSERSRTRYFNTAAFVDRTNPTGRSATAPCRAIR